MIPLHLLETLAVFSKSESLADAALKIGLTQPALTQHLQRLEQLCGLSLFTSKGRRKVLTQEGEQLAHISRQHVGDFQHAMQNFFLTTKDPRNRLIRFGARPEILRWLLPKVKPVCRVEYVGQSHNQILESLVEREIDLAITHERPNLPNIIAKQILSDSWSWVFHHDLKISPQVLKSKDGLKQFELLAYKSSLPQLSIWCQRFGIPVDELYVSTMCDDWDSVLQLVKNKRGIALMPTRFQTRGDNLQAIEVDKTIVAHSTFYLLYRLELKGQAIIKPFLDLIY